MANTVQQQQIEYQTGFAPQVAPYMERLLGGAEGTLFQYERDPSGKVILDESGMPKIRGFQPYQAYQGERVAQFSPLQQQAFQQAQQMTSAPQLAQASALAGQAGLAALNYRNYAPADVSTSRVTGPGLTQFQMGPAQSVFGREMSTPLMRTAQTQYAPQLTAPQMRAARDVQAQQITAPEMRAAQTGFAPSLTAFQMAPVERVTSQSLIGPGTAEAYMSPYMQSVVRRQQLAAQREADIQRQATGAQFAQSGAFGGGRFAVQQARAAEALARQKGDIQAQGLQSAFQQATQQFNAEQQARIQAMQANQAAQIAQQRANLESALGVQQLGTQTGLQTALANLNAEQQARVQNQAAQLQASGMNAQQALQAALANQQVQQDAARQNLASQLQTQQLQTQTGLQTALANLSAEQQANVQNQAAQLQTQGMNAQQALQAALANQQAGLTVGQQNLAAQLGIQQLGAQTGMQAQLANQQAQLQAQQLAEQSRQYGAGLGLQGLQTSLQGASQLGNLGQMQFGQNLAANQLQSQYGTQQQQQMQNILNNQYQDYLNAQNYPFRQMGFMSDILRGAPLTQTGTSVYGQAPSTSSQLVGLGTAAVGAAKLFGGKEGGLPEDFKPVDSPAGLADLAIYNMGR